MMGAMRSRPVLAALAVRPSSPALRALFLTATLAACSSGGGGSVTKTPSTPVNRSPILLSPSEGLGYLALSAPAAGEGSPLPWLPPDDSGVLVLLPDGAPAPKVGAEVTVVPPLGAPLRLAIGERTRVPFGCDDNTLEGLSLTPTAKAGAAQVAALPPGVVWVLPDSSTAASWKPSGLEVAPRELSPQKRVWAVGSLEIALTVKDRSHATFAAAAGNVWMMSRELERPHMAGAEDVPIDLTQVVAGMPSVVAAFSFMPTGAILLVVHTPSYEGHSLSALLYDGATIREVEAMQSYLYACAF